MKLTNIILSSIITSGVAAAPIAQAHAGACDSGTHALSQIWEKYDDVALAAGCAVLKLAGDGDLAQIPKCFLDAQTRKGVVEKMIKFYNDKIAKDGPGSLGPRRLALGEDLQGRVVSTTGRVFISESPIALDTVDIELEKLDGKGKAEVTVCTNFRDENEQAWTFVVEGKEAAGKTFKKTLTGVQGRLLKVHIDGKSLADTMQYRLHATAK